MKSGRTNKLLKGIKHAEVAQTSGPNKVSHDYMDADIEAVILS